MLGITSHFNNSYNRKQYVNQSKNAMKCISDADWHGHMSQNTFFKIQTEQPSPMLYAEVMAFLSACGKDIVDCHASF